MTEPTDRDEPTTEGISELDWLVDEYRSRCLWFLREDFYPATLAERLMVLAYVERHGDIMALAIASSTLHLGISIASQQDDLEKQADSMARGSQRRCRNCPTVRQNCTLLPESFEGAESSGGARELTYTNALSAYDRVRPTGRICGHWSGFCTGSRGSRVWHT